MRRPSASQCGLLINLHAHIQKSKDLKRQKHKSKSNENFFFSIEAKYGIITLLFREKKIFGRRTQL